MGYPKNLRCYVKCQGLNYSKYILAKFFMARYEQKIIMYENGRFKSSSEHMMIFLWLDSTAFVNSVKYYSDHVVNG